jgi:CBS domain containing-hemolysin-like protein
MNATTDVFLRLAATVALIAVNALFVFHEFAFVALKPGQIRTFDKDSSTVGRLVSKASHRLDHYIAVDQLGITASSLAVGWIGQPFVTELLRAAFGELGLSTTAMTAVSAVLAFALLTGTQMIVGELMPKSYALRHPARTARLTAGPVELTAKIFHPFVALLNGAGLAIVRLLGFRGTGESHHPTLPAEELAAIVHASARAGLLRVDPKALGRLLNFSDLRANDLMVPRLDTIVIDASATRGEVMETARRHLHDRYPVFEESPDRIVGMIDVKDLLAARADTASVREASWRRWVRPIPTLPETAPFEVVLATLNRTQKQMALLVDEFGSPTGIITATDIAQQLISGPDEIHPDPSGGFLIEGHASIALVESELGIDLEREGHNVETIAGLVSDELGRIPRPGDAITVNRHRLEVAEMDGHRITMVRVRLADAAAPGDR